MSRNTAERVVEASFPKKMNGEEARSVYEELRKIGKGKFDAVSVDDVVEAAKKQSSPLHKYFTWDVRKAAALQWKNEARELISTVRYVVEYQPGMDRSVRGLVSIRIDDKEAHAQRVFVPREHVKSNKDMRKKFVSEQIESLRQWYWRGIDFEELKDIRSAIAKVISIE